MTPRVPVVVVGAEAPEVLRHQRDRPKPSRALIPIIWALTSAFWVSDLGRVGPLALQPAQVGDLDRGAEPVPPVVAVHERAHWTARVPCGRISRSLCATARRP